MKLLSLLLYYNYCTKGRK